MYSNYRVNIRFIIFNLICSCLITYSFTYYRKLFIHYTLIRKQVSKIYIFVEIIIFQIINIEESKFKILIEIMI